MKDETLKTFDIKRDIDVVPNFIDIKKYTSVKKNNYRAKICDERDKLLIHTSNFRKVKRIQDVINVFCKIKKKKKCKLIMIGDGPERANIESLTRSLCSLRDVIFIGKVPRLLKTLVRWSLLPLITGLSV